MMDFFWGFLDDLSDNFSSGSVNLIFYFDPSCEKESDLRSEPDFADDLDNDLDNYLFEEFFSIGLWMLMLSVFFSLGSVNS